MILWRQAAAGLQLFWVRRADRLRFSGGFFAFPGGGLEPEDTAVPIESVTGEEAALRVAAAREVFEETGVLLARPSAPLRPDALAVLRRRLVAGAISFADVLASSGARLHASDLPAAGRWLTPDFSPVRFDARFFFARLPEGQEAEVWTGELAEGGWVRAEDALARWASGTALLHPPILHTMQAFERHAPEEALERLRAAAGDYGQPTERIEFQRGLLMFPLRTPTLPPASHTHCYLVGNREFLIVDPGSPHPEEQDRLARFVERLASEGRTPKAIVLTHHHHDHVAGAAVASRQLGVPIWAHADTAARVPGVARTLEDGERLVLEGEPRLELQVLHTPGHARGHLCLFEPATRALLCGDLISGASTVVIDPPDGDMTDYLASLERMRQLAPRVLFPGHGPTIVDGAQRIETYLRHRAWREARILDALADGPLAVAAVARRAYDDAPEALRPLAERSALAGLLKLERDRRVSRQGELFRLAD